MEYDVISQLLKFFRKLDTTKNWGLDPDEAVQITLENSETYLRSHIIDDYVRTVLENLEGVSYDRLGMDSQFFQTPELHDQLLAIIESSSWAKKDPIYKKL